MSDWIGLIFFVLLIVGVIVGLKVLSKPRTTTSDEFERSAMDNPSFTGALLNALHDVTDPAAKRSKEVRMQMKDGRFERRSGKGRPGEQIVMRSMEKNND